MAKDKTSGSSGSAWKYILIGAAAAIIFNQVKDIPLDGGDPTGGTETQRPALVHQTVEIEQTAYRSHTFEIGSPRTAVVEVRSRNGVPVDYFLAPLNDRIITEHLYDTGQKNSDVFIRHDNILANNATAYLPRAGKYALYVRHGHYSNSPFAEDRPPLQVTYKLYTQ